MIANEEWESICMLIEEGWPGEFTDAAGMAWRVFLDDYDAGQVLAALKALVAKGGKFRPSVAEVVGQLREDPSKPTFDETLTLIRTALRAYNRPLKGDFAGEAQMVKAREANVLARAEGMHPLVASFIARHGVLRLQDEVGELDGQYGAIRRAELEAAWSEHCAAMDGRDVAQLVAGRSGRGALAAFDPLAALNVDVLPKRLNAGQGA